MTDSKQFTTFVAAVREALRSDADRSDMKSLAKRALDLLSEDLVYEAAATHLTGLARREWNRLVQVGDISPHSDEVVSVRGQDMLLGDTEEDDREWLASHREALSDGLANRAAMFRAMDGAGRSVGPVIKLTTRAVLAAERRAQQMASLADALDAMTDGLGEGTSVAEQEIAAAIDRWNAGREVKLKEIEALAVIVEVIESMGFEGQNLAASRRAARQLEELV